MNIEKTWAELKVLLSNKKIVLQYTSDDQFYYLFADEGTNKYVCSLYKDPADADIIDFEANYKAACNASSTVKAVDGRPYVYAASRPTGTATYFTSAGDDLVTPKIGDGKRLAWDFSNSDDEISAPAGFKRKRLDIQFLDPVWVKEGTVYFHNSAKGSYCDFSVVCPAGGYYYDNTATLQLAGVETTISHYINKHPVQGSVPMGDELNTEGATEQPVPTNYIIRMEVTAPTSDVTGNGVIEMELFRTRTVIL